MSILLPLLRTQRKQDVTFSKHLNMTEMILLHTSADIYKPNMKKSPAVAENTSLTQVPHKMTHLKHNWKPAWDTDVHGKNTLQNLPFVKTFAEVEGVSGCLVFSLGLVLDASSLSVVWHSSNPKESSCSFTLIFLLSLTKVLNGLLGVCSLTKRVLVNSCPEEKSLEEFKTRPLTVAFFVISAGGEIDGESKTPWNNRRLGANTELDQWQILWFSHSLLFIIFWKRT